MSRRALAKQRGPWRLLLTVVQGGLLAAALGLIATFSVSALVFHVRVSPVLTGSMRPTYAPGDVILTRRVDVHSLRPGDIAVFVPPGETAAFAHRVTSVSTHDGQVVVTTKGDANPAADPWHAKLNGSTVPKVIGTLPAIGRPLTWIHTRWLQATAIAALGLLLTIVGTVQILRTPSRKELLT
ncbi:MAG: signal peptidase I [Actinomycetes bacterium]